MKSKYQRSDEVKFRDKRPSEGQEIALRLAGMKTYWRARYKGPDNAELYGKDGNLNGSVVQVYGATSASGWCPETPIDAAHCREHSERPTAECGVHPTPAG